MPSLQEIHQQSYSDMPFNEFAQKFHGKFYSDMPYDQFMAKAGGQAKAPPQETSALSQAVSPVTNIPGVYSEMVNQSVDQMKQGAGRVSEGFGKVAGGDYLGAAKDIGLGAGNALLGAAGYVGAPINAPIHSIIGKPVENNVENLTGSKTAGQLAGSVADIGATLGIPLPKRVPNLSAPSEIAAASERLGVPIPQAAAVESIPAKASAGAVAQVPVVGTPLVKASKDAVAGMDDAARSIAAGYGEAERFAAGTSAKEGLTSWITGDSKDIASRVYGNVDKLVNPNVAAPLSETQKAVQGILSERKQAFLPEGKAVGMVADAIQPGAQLTYDGVKRLRTSVGEAMEGGIIPEGMSKGDLKRIYGALTSDLRNTVTQAGGTPALEAFDKANSIQSQISARREALAKIVGTDGNAAPEMVLDRLIGMASGTRGGDLSKLSQARKAIGAEGWNDVAAAAVDKLGRAAPEADFSGERFLTAWEKMSPFGKQLLFNSTGKGNLVQSLDDLATLSKAHKSLMEYGNPSGTGRAVTFTGMAGAAWANPIGALSGAIGGNVLARVLASPVGASSASKWALAFDKANSAPSPARAAALAGATRNLVNNLADMGISVPNVRSLAGQAPAKADQPEQ